MTKTLTISMGSAIQECPECITKVVTTWIAKKVILLQTEGGGR